MSAASNRDSDPLLRAIATGDEHCPDGKALAKLGRLIRGEQPLASDLRTRVESRLAASEGQLATDDAERIDQHYERDGADPELDRLRGLFSGIAPAPVDLRERVRKQLIASSRLAPISAEAPVSSRAEALLAAQRRRRLRLVISVVIGHVAAVLVIAILIASNHTRTVIDEHGGWSNPTPPVPRLPEHGPRDWMQLPGSGFDLFALRRTPELRAAARARFNCERSAGAVACGLRWLQTRQDAAGRFATEATAPILTGHTLATLALLGEGGGGTSIDRARLEAARRALTALDQDPLLVDASTAARPRALVALARTEGALLGLSERTKAEAALRDLSDHLDPQVPLDGFAALAVETAQQGGLVVPSALLARSRELTAMVAPAAGEPDVGRLGLVTFARVTLGYRDNPATTSLADALVAVAPTAERSAPVDASDWLFATLALREVGGTAWDTWIATLQSHVIPLFSDAGPGLASVTASADPVQATAAAVLDLQAAYRYLPLDRQP